MRHGTALLPQVQGGSQERQRRAGTENVAAIVGFGAAAKLARERLVGGAMEKVAALRDQIGRAHV